MLRRCHGLNPARNSAPSSCSLTPLLPRHWKCNEIAAPCSLKRNKHKRNTQARFMGGSSSEAKHPLCLFGSKSLLLLVLELPGRVIHSAHLPFLRGKRIAKDVFHILQEVLLTMEPALLQPHEHLQETCGVPAWPGNPSLALTLFFLLFVLIGKDLNFSSGVFGTSGRAFDMEKGSSFKCLWRSLWKVIFKKPFYFASWQWYQRNNQCLI